jgi:hypothetical protein
MLMSFVPQAQLADPTFDTFRSVNIGIQRLTLTYGDGTQLYTTTFRDQNEILTNYLFALRASDNFGSALATPVGLGSATTSPVQTGYGIGVSFEGGVDMRSSQLGVVMEGIEDGGLLPISGYLVFQGAFAL